MDQTKLESFLQKVVGDMSSSLAGAMTNVGHKLGLYRALAEHGPCTSEELARATGYRERYVREWLNVQAAGGYVEYDVDERRYSLPPEHAAVLVDPRSPVFLAPGFDVVSSVWIDEDKFLDAFRSGKGLGWHEHSPRLFSGTEAFFRPGYRANLVSSWIPACEGLQERMTSGIEVADVGCGHGASTIVMAEAFPRSRFHGFDYHPGSIETARRRAQEAGVADRVTFEVAPASAFPGDGYGLVCFFDCFHDLGDPRSAAERSRRALAGDGTLLLVEPMAGDRTEDNLHPVGRLFYAASTAICCPNSLSQEVGTALGAQAGEARLTEILREAGFSRVRRAAETPFNMVLEARP